jgi:hypothetical protein
MIGAITGLTQQAAATTVSALAATPVDADVIAATACALPEFVSITGGSMCLQLSELRS